MFNLEEFLLLREKRVEFQKRLVRKYKSTLIVVRTNYPGENKLEILSLEIVNILAKIIEEKYENKICHKEVLENMEGKFYLFLINDDASKIKKQMMYIEDKHILGRCVDIDVFSDNYQALSRKNFDISPRKCMLCDDVAFACARSSKHQISEIKEFMLSKLIEYNNFNLKRNEISKKLADKALEAMIYEVSTSPSYGLVSPLTSGAHSDMDFFTFLESSFAIKEYFEKMATIAYSYEDIIEIFKKGRNIGIEAEKSMFKATNNINTHKGMIFLIGISVMSISKIIYESLEIEDAKKFIEEIGRYCLKDFDDLKNKSEFSHGEKLFLEHGFTGIRGEIRDGLTIVFDQALPILKKYLTTYDKNTAFSKTLIYIMSLAMDSTIVYRHDFKTLEKVQNESLKLINCEDKSTLIKLEEDYIKKRISPGGSADLLAVTIFINSIEEMLK